MKLFCCLILPFFFFEGILPQWSTDPNTNTPICTASNDQFFPAIISDGSGGAIITWEDFRNGNNYDVYVQRINYAGVVLWSLDGVPIATVTRDQSMPVITEDGQGGAIIVWNDFRSGNYSDIYAQKINSNGAVQWAANGIPVCSAVNDQRNPTVVSDGSGGAIITWQDQRDGAFDIYAQRIDANGNSLWTSEGVVICNAANKQEYPQIASDASNGAIITWQDNRAGTSLNPDYDIYVQRINANGNVQWMINGLPVSSVNGQQVYPKIINNNNDEVIITWHDSRNGVDADIYAQRLNKDGTIFWSTNGVALCTATGSQSFPVLVSDGGGGAIVTWQDYRSGAYDIYAQRININGDILWTTDGVPISTEANAQMSPDIIDDGQGGAIITWRDYRNNSNQNIYAQLINSNGIVQWIQNGLVISTADPSQYTPSITSDGAGGAIIVWWDYRNGSTSDLFAQQVNHSGQLGVVTEVEKDAPSLPESFRLEQNYPNPFNPSTTIGWQSPVSSWHTIKLYDLMGREIETIVDGYYEAGSHSTLFIVNSSLPSGVYFYQLKVGNHLQTRKMILLK